MGFPRPEYWNGLPFPSLGDFPDPGIISTFPTTAGEFFTTEPPGSHEIKRRLLLLISWKESYDKIRQRVTKQRHHFANKCLHSQSYGFPSSMYGCDSWTIKKVECQRIDAFELWFWRRFLRVPWTARRSNQSILKGSQSKYSMEGLTLKLKLQYFGHLM